MSLTKSIFGKICILACICFLQVCCSETSKAGNASDVTTSLPVSEAESKLVETAVKLDGQESYQISKAEPYPHSDHGYIQQTSLYKQDPYKSEDQSSHSEYGGSFEHYKQQYLSHQAPAYHTANQDSHHSGYGSDGYHKDRTHQEQVHVESDYGYPHSGKYEVDGYGSDKSIPYGTKLPVRTKEKSYPRYSKEIGQKQRQLYNSAKYSEDKSKYIAQEVSSKEYGSKSYYENSDSGKGDVYVSKEQPYSSSQGETSYGHESPQISQQLIYEQLDAKHVDGKSGYSSSGGHASPEIAQHLIYDQFDAKDVDGKSGYSSHGGYASPQIAHQSYDQLDAKHVDGKSGYSSHGGHASAQLHPQQYYDQTDDKHVDGKSGYSSHGAYASPQITHQLYDDLDTKHADGKSGYSSHGGHASAQLHQQQYYDQTDDKHLDGKSGYDSHGSKEIHQPAVVTSYYYRGIKTHSSIPVKTDSKKYVSSGQEYFPVIPKEAEYISSVKEQSYVQDAKHAVVPEDGQYVSGHSKQAGDGKMAIYIKQLGHSLTGDKYGKGGERHGFLLLPVLPGKQNDAVQIAHTNFYNIGGNKYGNIHQGVDTSAYGYSPIQEDHEKIPTYKGKGGIHVQELKSVYQSPESYNQKFLISDVGKTATHGSSYDDGGKGKSSHYGTNKENTYVQDTSSYGEHSSYKDPVHPSSFKGSSFKPIIPKSNQIISNGYGNINHEEYNNQKTHQNLGKSSYEHQSPLQYSKSTGFQPSYYFPPTSSAPQVPVPQFSSYGKSEIPKSSAQSHGYSNQYERVQLASGYLPPKSSIASQKRIKSYAIVLQQKPHEQIQVDGYGASAYPAASVRKSKLLSGRFTESLFKPIIGKSSTLHSRSASLSHNVKSQTVAAAFSPVAYSQRSSKKY